MGDRKVERQVAIAQNCRQMEEEVSFKRHFFEALMTFCPPIFEPGSITNSDVQDDPAEECGSRIILEEEGLEEYMLEIKAFIASLGGPLDIDDSSSFSDL